MSCREYLPLINDLADGTLNGRNKKRVNGHLSDCRECSGDLKKTKKLKTLLRKLNSDNPGKKYFADVTNQILMRLDSEGKFGRTVN